MVEGTKNGDSNAARNYLGRGRGDSAEGAEDKEFKKLEVQYLLDLPYELTPNKAQ